MKKDILQIKAIYFLMIAIPVFVTSYFFVYENISQRKIAEINKNVTIAQTSAMYVEYGMNEMLEQMRKTAKMPAFKRLNKAGMREIIDLLHSDKYEFSVTDTMGNVLVGSHNGEYRQYPNIKDSIYLGEVLKGKSFITGMHKSHLTGEYVIGFHTPVFDDSGKIVAVMEAHIKNTFFKQYIDSVKVGEAGRLSLIDGNGFYIYDREIDNDKQLQASRCFQDGKSQDLSITERMSLRSGEMMIFTKVRLKTLDWYLVAFQPSTDIAAPGIQMVTRNILNGVFMISILFLLWQYKASLEHRKMLVERQNAEKLALIGELAAGMAHEIRNPLTAIKGFSDLLKNKEKYRDDRDIFNLLASSVDHIEGIVRETLLLSKPQKREVGYVDIRAMVAETCNFMQNEAVLREINLDCKKGNTPLVIKGDELHLKQVLINIIKNSLEATSKGGYVKVNSEEMASCAKLTIQDNGIGIPPELLNKIGNPFFTTKPNGTGLGLSVCRRVIEEHGGSLKISSAPEKGTMVEILLPLTNC